MSKALEPEDCRRGHQIVPTRKLVGMLERYGFVERPGGAGSHRHYIHPQHPDLGALTLIVNTAKRDCQFEIAGACEEVERRNAKPVIDTRAQWLEKLEGQLGQHERMILEAGEVTVTLRDHPAIGVKIPVEGEVSALAAFRNMSARFTAMLDTCIETFGLREMQDEDGTLHVYRPEWRTALTLHPFGSILHQDPLIALSQWQNGLRDLKKSYEADMVADALTDALRKRYPDDIVLRNVAGKIILRDGEAPQIGMTVCMKDTDDQIAAKHKAMKNTGTAFATRLDRLKTDYEFKIRSGHRTLYLNHLVYEHIAAAIPLFSKDGDDTNAFVTLQKMEEATTERDRFFKYSTEDYDVMRMICRDLRIKSSGELVVQEGHTQQIGSKNKRPVRFADTPLCRRSLAQDAQLHQDVFENQLRDHLKALAAMGFSTQRMPDGILRVVHMHFENMAYEIGAYDGVCASVTLKDFAAPFISSARNEEALEKYIAARNQAGIGLVGATITMVRALNDRIAQCRQNFESADKVILNEFGYSRVCQRLGGVRWEFRYTKKDAGGLGPAQFTVPVVRLFDGQGDAALFATEKSVAAIKENLAKQYPVPYLAAPARAVPPVYTPLFGLLPPAAQQDVIRATATIGLPRLNGL